ncbi:metabolite-proton symporter [Rathayibacter oskolensis]|uniref:Metabolite-proton symporter n=1 Tax=Rathayibacter oskolensis TaxID=1891671 RepID=A0A1X7P1H1_9MICO|nr:MFS transporter [Rathayibacter oskolensis]SMH43994.1 metabolite-proton symporter [Rathayibacter oskolensis]
MTPRPATARQLRRVVAGSVVGTALEAYDLYLYGTAAALVFGQLFFSAAEPAAAMLLSLSTFAISFVGRPLGAIVFGHIGDRLGRKRTLVITLLLMGISTFLIGVLPTYEAIGVSAPIILTVLRFAQGFGYGGEYTGGVLMLAEHAPAHQRGFYTGLNNAAPVAGFVASSVLFLVMGSYLPADQFLDWGWRVPFLVSILLVGVGLYVRQHVEESPVYLRARADGRDARSGRVPLFDVLRHHPREIAIVAGVNISQFATFYLIATFSLSYGSTERSIDRTSILAALIIGVATNAITIPLAAMLSDRIGRRPVVIAGSVAMIVWAFPFFALFDTGDFSLMVLAFTGGMASYGIVYAPLAAFTSELFDTPVRYTGSAVGYNLGGILGGALAPVIATVLYSTSGSTIPISLYLITVAAISLLVVLVVRETRDVDLTLADPPSKDTPR